MAFTTVVTSPFFEKMISFLGGLEKGRGPIALAMITPYDIGQRESWNLFLASKWLDEIPLRTATREITEQVRQHLGPMADHYNGTWITRTNEAIVDVFTAAFDIPHPGTAYRAYLPELQVFDIEEAVLFVANASARTTYKEHKISA